MGNPTRMNNFITVPYRRTYIGPMMPSRATVAFAILLLCTACGPVTSRAPIQTTPEAATACAGELLASMGYSLLEQEPVLRAERPKHAAAGKMRVDYDRVAVAVDGNQLRVRGETVSMSAGGRFMATRGEVASSAGGTAPTVPSKEVRADVKRVAMECGGGG